MMPIGRRGMVVAACLLCASFGCTGAFPSDPELLEQRDRVLGTYVTEEAIAELVAGPIRFGNTARFGGLALGDDLVSYVGALILGNPPMRQVLVASPGLSDLSIMHEYVHQAAISGFIDRSWFVAAYARLKKDETYADIPTEYEPRVRDNICVEKDWRCPIVFAYDDGVGRELVAYLIQDWVTGQIDLPDYLLDVYRRTLRIDELKIRHDILHPRN